MNEIKYVQMVKKYCHSLSNNVMMIAGNLQIFLNSTKIYVMWSHNKDTIIHPWPINYAYFICINYQDCEKFTLSKYSSLNYSMNNSSFLLKFVLFIYLKSYQLLMNHLMAKFNFLRRFEIIKICIILFCF